MSRRTSTTFVGLSLVCVMCPTAEGATGKRRPGPPRALLVGDLAPVRMALEAVASAMPSGPIDLPTWTPPDGVTTRPFRVGTGGKAMRIWGGRLTTGRFFVDEFLPALFERTLSLEQVDLQGGALSWLFTGDRGGFTVSVGESRVTLAQRFYDSFGHNELRDGRIRPQRHAERRWVESSVDYNGQLRAVSVALDHKLGLTVRLNGREALRQQCEFDVSRHQVRLSGKGSATGQVLSPSPVTATVRVEPGKRHQTMMGFGGITTPTAYAQLSPAGKRRWWRLVCEYNLLIQREYPIGNRLNEAMNNWDCLADATPHYYGDNFPNGEVSDFAYIKALRTLGGKVFFEFWALPLWTRQDWTDEKGKVHKGVADPAVFAKAMVNYCRTSNARAGAPPDVVGIQNEIAQPAPIWYEMTRSLRRALDEAGFGSVRIHMSDHGHLSGGIGRAREFKASSETWKLIDYAATHMYDYQSRFTDPDAYDKLLREWHALTKDKPFLSTELCINSPRYQRPSYRLALTMGQLYHKNLTLTDAAAICYCWTLLNVVQPSYGGTRSLCVPDRANGFVPVASSAQLRVFGAFSRRIREGMTRLAASSSDTDVLATAFAGQADNATVVLLNRSTVPRRVRVTGIAAALKDLELVDPYHENEVRPCPAPMSDGAIEVVVSPGALVTLTNVELGRLPEGFRI